MHQHWLGSTHVAGLHVAKSGGERGSCEKLQQMPLLSHAVTICADVIQTITKNSTRSINRSLVRKGTSPKLAKTWSAITRDCHIQGLPQLRSTKPKMQSIPIPNLSLIRCTVYMMKQTWGKLDSKCIEHTHVCSTSAWSLFHVCFRLLHVCPITLTITIKLLRLVPFPTNELSSQ